MTHNAKEAVFVKNLLVHLRGKGAFCFKIHGGPFQMAGLPDVVGCYKGYFFAFECKRQKDGRPTALQLHVIEKIKEAGGISAVVTTIEEADRCFTENIPIYSRSDYR